KATCVEWDTSSEAVMGLLLPFSTSTTKVVSSWNCSQGEEEAVEELVARKNVNALGIYFAEWDTWT
ncbi:hypothetical protein U1Q18_014257, partial [Sarracenia purpurea var. burkii]